MKPVLRRNCQSARGIEVAAGGGVLWVLLIFLQNYGLQVLSYKVVMIFSFRNGTELSKRGA